MGRNPAYEFDVFVSYAEADRPWVERELLPRLQSAKLKTFVDFNEFMPGAVGVEEFERGVKSSRRTILLYSPNYLAYSHAHLGSVLARHLDPTAKERRCIPVKIIPCEIPSQLSYLVPTDLTSQDTQERQREWEKLIKSLKGRRNRQRGSQSGIVKSKNDPLGEQVADAVLSSLPATVLGPALEAFGREAIFPAECDDVIGFLQEQLQKLDEGRSQLHKRYALKPRLQELINVVETFRSRYPNVSGENQDTILHQLRDISEELDRLG